MRRFAAIFGCTVALTAAMPAFADVDVHRAQPARSPMFWVLLGALAAAHGEREASRAVVRLDVRRAVERGGRRHAVGCRAVRLW